MSTVIPQIAMSMFEYKNLDWDTATDVPVDPVVLNDWYEPLPLTRNVKAWYLVVEQTNNGATIESIEVELTINGVVTPRVISAANGTLHYMMFDIDGDLQLSSTAIQMLSLDLDQSAPLETRSLRGRVRQTTTVDLVSAIIEVNMVYATLEYAT